MRWRMPGSDSLRAAAAMGLGGLAFTLGNLLFARALPSADYGLISLLLGVVAVGGLAAPLGLDLVICRRGLSLTPPWRRAALLACVVTALATAAASAAAYGLPLAVLACIAVLVLAIGMLQSAAAHLQAHRRYERAVLLLQLSNAALVPAGLAALLLHAGGAARPCILMAGLTFAGACGVWIAVRRELRSGCPAVARPAPAPRALLAEALALVSLSLSSSVFLQLERLLLAPLSSVHELALYGVLAALVGSPFRLLQAAVQFTLVPELRRCEGPAARLRLLRREVQHVGAVILLGTVAVALAARPIAHWVLAGRYDLAPGLLVAALVSGVLKVFCAFALAVVVALAPEARLRGLSVGSWLCIGIAAVGALVGARWGLIGVLYGTCAGWIARTLLAAWIAAPLLAERSVESGRDRAGALA